MNAVVNGGKLSCLSEHSQRWHCVWLVHLRISVKKGSMKNCLTVIGDQIKQECLSVNRISSVLSNLTAKQLNFIP